MDVEIGLEFSTLRSTRERNHVADVLHTCYELVVRAVLNIPEIGKIAGIGQLVDIDDPVVGIFAYKKPDDVAADESGSARDDYVSLEFHCLTVI